VRVAEEPGKAPCPSATLRNRFLFALAACFFVCTLQMPTENPVIARFNLFFYFTKASEHRRHNAMY